jgi:hypothetical protein
VPHISRRHSASLVLGGDALVQFAPRGFAGDNGEAALAEVDPGAVFAVKVKFGFPLGYVRTMATEAFVGEDGADAAVELYYTRKSVGINGERYQKSTGGPTSH